MGGRRKKKGREEKGDKWREGGKGRKERERYPSYAFVQEFPVYDKYLETELMGPRICTFHSADYCQTAF